MRKILIVGATYADNFGDMLFAKMIADSLVNKCEFRFYRLSDYARKFVGDEKIADFNLSDAEALVYMPGGFFGDRHDTSLLTTLRWFWRYFPVGLKFAYEKKPILILGVGAGPCKYQIMRKFIEYICKNATKVIVRESQSQEFLKEMDIESVVTSDMAQTIGSYELQKVVLRESKKKKLLVHINQNQGLAEVILPAVQAFYEQHQEEYDIVVASDQICPEDHLIYEKVREFAGDCTFFYKYGAPLELCSVIQQCDTIVTYKLHVGVIACSYGKSVIAVPEHYKKVERYYQHIGYPERVLPCYRASVEEVTQMLEKYADIPIMLSKEIMEAAQSNYKELELFIEALK